MKLNTKYKCSIAYNDWVYEKVCLDELSKLPILMIANFLIHFVIHCTVYYDRMFIWNTDKNFLKMWVGKLILNIYI